MARLNAHWLNFSERGQSWYHYWQDSKATAGGNTLTAAYGAFVLTGQTVNFSRIYRLTTTYRSYALAGQTAGLLNKHILNAAYRALVLTKEPANLLFKRRLAAEQRSYALTGQSLNLLTAHKLTAAYRTYALTGQAVTLTYNPITLHYYTLTAGCGELALTGEGTSLLFKHLLSAAQAEYTLDGQSAGLLYVPHQGQYTLTTGAGHFGITMMPLMVLVAVATIRPYIRVPINKLTPIAKKALGISYPVVRIKGRYPRTGIKRHG